MRITCKLLALATALLAASAQADEPEIDALVGLGDRFYGVVSTPEDVDLLLFEALASTTLSVTIKGDVGLTPYAEVFDVSTGTFLSTIALSKGLGSKSYGIKKLVLPNTGYYQLVIGGLGTVGAYKAQLKGKIPKLKGSFWTISNPGGGMIVLIDAVPGSSFSATVKPWKGSAFAPLVYPLLLPNEQQMPLVPWGVVKGATVKIKKAPLPQLGKHVLLVENNSIFDVPAGVTVSIKTAPPKPLKISWVEAEALIENNGYPLPRARAAEGLDAELLHQLLVAPPGTDSLSMRRFDVSDHEAREEIAREQCVQVTR